jgi:hypothetical protein
MRKSLQRRPSLALVVSFVALFIALGGSAYAGFGLAKNSVGTKQLKNGAVTTSKIRNGAVTSSKINGSGVTVSSALHANSATTAGSATSASNAGSLGSIPASGYTRNDCSSQTGQIKGWAIISGSASFSSTFVPVAGYNCASGFGTTGQVEAQRLGTGLYEVKFPNNPDTIIFGSTFTGFVDQHEQGPGDFIVGVRDTTGALTDQKFDVLSP